MTSFEGCLWSSKKMNYFTFVFRFDSLIHKYFCTHRKDTQNSREESSWGFFNYCAGRRTWADWAAKPRVLREERGPPPESLSRFAPACFLYWSCHSYVDLAKSKNTNARDQTEQKISDHYNYDLCTTHKNSTYKQYFLMLYMNLTMKSLRRSLIVFDSLW